jgi:hypothetical protein
MHGYLQGAEDLFPCLEFLMMMSQVFEVNQCEQVDAVI